MKYRWQRQKPQLSNADDWLMTYADMITLLLCFFVILLIVSVSKKNGAPKPVATQIVEQVVEPALPPAPPPPPLPQPEIIPQPVQLAPVQPSPMSPDGFQGDLPFHDAEPEEKLATNAAPPTKAADLAPAEVQAPAISSDPTTTLQTPIPAMFEDKGDRIKIFEVNSAAFFASGSAALSEAGMAILRDVAVNLKSDAFKDYLITVEGHTDDSPIHTVQFPSNWELSTARASAVVHFFLNQNIPARRLRAAGYADSISKAPNRDASGNAIPANQALNRRVVIKLEKIEKN